jgi:hypothetical protein
MPGGIKRSSQKQQSQSAGGHAGALRLLFGAS